MARNASRQAIDIGRADQSALPIMLLLFVGSGCSALIYEVVWFHLLRLVVGSSGVSIGVLLGTFMGGMCIGSLLLPRLISTSRHPFRVYALLELSIGIFGLILLYLIPLIGQFYISLFTHGLVSILIRGALAAICLLPPTILMGATLPAIARWIESTPRGIGWMGYFYGTNIAGAVFGCLLAGFYLLRVHDVVVATWTAIGINVFVAALAYLVSTYVGHQRKVVETDSSNDEQAGTSRNWSAYLVVCISGACSLGAEVVWTRQLSLMLGASVYTFSIILAVFLIGLGIGSTIGSLLAQRLKNPALMMGWCQGLLALAVLWTAYCLGASLPYWPIDPGFASDPWLFFQLDIVRCLWAMLPAAMFWGATFPLALASVKGPQGDSGKLVGGVYAANTVGAILGAVAVSMVLIPTVGSKSTQQIIMMGCLISAVVSFGYLLFVSTDGFVRAVSLVASVLMAIVGGIGIGKVPETPVGLIAYGRNLPYTNWDLESGDWSLEYLYSGEGMNASIAVSEEDSGYRNFHVSGKVVASSDPNDMRLQLMLGHLPALMHEKPKSALIVGCGAGVTSGTFMLHPEFERIVICEIEPLIPPAAGKYFADYNNDVINDPRVEIVFDDARHFVSTTDEKFDIITSDPIHPWVKGAAALYSREYYELCKKRLNPGGYITQWVPLYESNEAAVKSEVATFFDAFPQGTIWGNDVNGEGYDVVMLAQSEPKAIDFGLLSEKMASTEYQDVVSALRQIDLGDPVRIVSKYAGDASELADWLDDAEINHDKSLRLQYLAGISLNNHDEEAIYSSMVSRRKYPAKHVSANESDEAMLRVWFDELNKRRGRN